MSMNNVLRSSIAGALALTVIGLVAGRGSLLGNVIMGAVVGLAVNAAETVLLEDIIK